MFARLPMYNQLVYVSFHNALNRQPSCHKTVARKRNLNGISGKPRAVTRGQDKIDYKI